MTPEIINAINIIGGISSIAISIIAIGLAITFYLAGRRTEISVSSSLAEIKAQTNALQKLSGKQIDKLMEHAFDGKISTSEAMNQIINILLYQLPTTTLKQPVENPNQEQIIALYAALYFYTAQTNYWSQFYLPKANEFENDNNFHVFTKRIVDLSWADFDTVANWLGQSNQALVEKTPLYSY